MKKLKTLEATKKEILELQAYVYLVENYQIDTLERRIIKFYAYTNSIPKVLAEVNTYLALEQKPLVDHLFITDFIKSSSSDELHKIVRANYLVKTKHTRKKIR